MTRSRIVVLILALGLWPLRGDAHAQTRPPAVTYMNLHGVPRGATTMLTVIGANLNDADAVIFDEPGISAKILSIDDQTVEAPAPRPGATDAPIQDIAHKCEVRLAITVRPDVDPRTYAFRIRTPLGTTPLRTLAIGTLDEVAEVEPNDAPSAAQALTLPITVNGRIQEAGDVDFYRFEAHAGQQIVMTIASQSLGGQLDSVLDLSGADGTPLAKNDDASWQTRDSRLIYTIAKSGPHTLRVTDALGNGNGGRNNNFFYRLTIGELPLVTNVFPLGGTLKSTRTFSLEGANLPAPTSLSPATRDTSFHTATQTDVVPLAVRAADGRLLNELRVARGRYPEVAEVDLRSGSALGQRITLPATINGRIDRRKNGSSADTFRFSARKGQQIIFAVAAERLGSPLDAVLDIRDARGRPVPRAILRPVWETTVDLRDRGSIEPALRLLSTAGLHRGDYLFVDRELVQIRELPKSPDEDVQLMGYRGRRYSFEGTSGEGHANTRPVYKVEIHPPGTTFSPNGLPLFELSYRNDDGGPLYGKDPYLDFTAPADGEYLLRIADARGQSGRAYAYRLTAAPPRPDFSVFVSPTNPNVPRGSRVPITVFAFRHDGFAGPIDVHLEGLPAGIAATPGVILPGENAVALTLTASDTASTPGTPFTVVAQARINDALVTRNVDLDRVVPIVTTTKAPDVRVVSVEPSVIELEPGKRATVHVAIARANGFAGRVPLSVLNLPFRLTIPNTGLNGILITEQQDARDFVIEADPAAPPFEQTLSTLR